MLKCPVLLPFSEVPKQAGKQFLWCGRAASMADRMMGAFDTPTGIPLGQIDLKDSKSAATSWAGQGNSILSELGSVQLEFVHLSTRTGNATYRIAAERIIEFLHDKYGDQVGYSSQIMCSACMAHCASGSLSSVQPLNVRARFCMVHEGAAWGLRIRKRASLACLSMCVLWRRGSYLPRLAT